MAKPRFQIDQLIINSPYKEPSTYWNYDREIRMFERKDGRRPAGYVVATPGSKAFDDPGPNTGGMGAYSPAPAATAEVLDAVQSQIIVPIVDALRRDDTPYLGVLYCGLMLTSAGPKVLEFNCRFGDPEAQVVLTRLRSDFLEVIIACTDGRLDQMTLDWDERPAVAWSWLRKDIREAITMAR